MYFKILGNTAKLTVKERCGDKIFFEGQCFDVNNLWVKKVTSNKKIKESFILWGKTKRKNKKTKIIELEEYNIINDIKNSDIEIHFEWFYFEKTFLFSSLAKNIIGESIGLSDVTDDLLPNHIISMNSKKEDLFEGIKIKNKINKEVFYFKYNENMGCHRLRDSSVIQ
mgnify:CR=1 FL=1|tara:strand:+ start:2333 stop:2836 length:504 start_codon:yes stop_codon:yes gene_type:complete